MCESKFYRCNHCGNIIGMVKDAGVPVVCCGEKMAKLEPNTQEAATEKHIPVVEQNGNELTVKVGSVAHPMTDEHLIEWIYVCTDRYGHKYDLKAGEAPEAKFTLQDGEKAEVFAYCNLHGLWKC